MFSTDKINATHIRGGYVQERLLSQNRHSPSIDICTTNVSPLIHNILVINMTLSISISIYIEVNDNIVNTIFEHTFFYYWKIYTTRVKRKNLSN